MSYLPQKPEGVDSILIIEDEKAYRPFWAKALEMQGYQVTTYETHEDFEDAVRTGTDNVNNYHLIISDNTTGGGMNGIQFADKYGAQVPIILCTSEHTAIQKASDAGTIKGSLQKPFDLKVLANKVNKVANEIVNPTLGREID